MYVDGFVIAVPNDKKSVYLEHAEATAEVFKEHGAIEVVENWGDDVPDGVHTSLIKAVQCEKDETVVFSWIVWPSKDARESGMQACMTHPIFQPGALPMPFDGKRMIFGSFDQILKV